MVKPHFELQCFRRICQFRVTLATETSVCPSDFVVSLILPFSPFSLICVKSSCELVKGKISVFDPFTAILQRLHHISISEQVSFNDSVIFCPDRSTEESSANLKHFIELDKKSEMKIINSTGERTLPSGSPIWIPKRGEV